MSVYRLGARIGAGTSGVVYAAQDEISGEAAAIKTIKKTSEARRGVAREVESLRRLRHPHIVQLLGFQETEDMYFLVLERAADQCLVEYLPDDGLPEAEARRIFQQVISAVEHCHSKSIAHRDIKLDNILLDFNNNAKLADFGVSRTIQSNEFMRTLCGSLEYVAPEVLAGCGYRGVGADVWACGVVLHTLLRGEFPWKEDGITEMLSSILGNGYTAPESFPTTVAKLIARILTVRTRHRCMIWQIQMHPWFQQDWPESLQNLSQAARLRSARAALNSGEAPLASALDLTAQGGDSADQLL